jgi:predicted ATP-binding protein involved in virulence
VAFDAHRLVPAIAVGGPNIHPVARSRIQGALAPTFDSKGDLNRRFGLLKQWIVNIDFQRAKAKADRNVDLPTWARLRRGLDTLLHPVRFVGVDDAFDVIFETPTGEVELSELSDGFRSVFVIVAELMMRLSLSTDQPETMLDQEAVCIIDEIDAHLHPKWQQRIIPGLRALFPNVQIIATTHSPFVVESVAPQSIFKLVEVSQ